MTTERNKWIVDNNHNRELYQKKFQEHGATFRGMGWGSKESQLKRFSVLGDIGCLKGASIMDVGCGVGHLLRWLEEHTDFGSYLGVDINPKAIEQARNNYSHGCFRQLDLYQQNLEKTFDFVFASGIFTFRETQPYGFLEYMAEVMFSKAEKGLGFNILSEWSDNKEEGEFYADPIKVLKICSNITTNISLRHDYHPGDFTVYMYDNQNVVDNKIDE